MSLSFLFLASCWEDSSTQTPTETTQTPTQNIEIVEVNDEDIEAAKESMMEDETEAMETPEDEKMESSDDVMEKDDAIGDTMMDKDEEHESGYKPYSADLVGAWDNTVIFFHAPWCPSCVAADSAISSGTVPDDVLILQADYDSNTDLKKKYGVVTQHTFVQVDENGEKIKSWVGGNSLDDIVSKVQ